MHDDDDDLPPTAWQRFTQHLTQFQQLDLQQYDTWSSGVRWLVSILSAIIILLFVGFVFLLPKYQQLQEMQQQQQQSLQSLQVKDAKLRNAQQIQQQLAQLEQHFQQAMLQFPQASELPSVLESIHRVGATAGLQITNLRLENEVEQDVLIEQALLIEATGGYHQFGRFVSEFAQLPRVMDLQDFDVVAQMQSNSDLPLLHYKMTAKLYRYRPLDKATDRQNTGK
ncbi:MAG: type 4a pilus biogenesis protein PilO [Acinetobacter sp.]|nr:type 4a pilus biogenesis protein PilO [Acinetobacter sp.]